MSASPPRMCCGHDVHVLPGPQERREGLGQLDLDVLVVDDLQVLDQVEAAAGADRDLRVHDRLVGELDVLGREGLAVAPLHAALERDLPDQPVRRDAAVLARRHLDREVGDELALVVHVPERVEHAGLGHVLRAAVDVEQRVELHRLLRHADDDAVLVLGRAQHRGCPHGDEARTRGTRAGDEVAPGQARRSLMGHLSSCLSVATLSGPSGGAGRARRAARRRRS